MATDAGTIRFEFRFLTKFIGKPVSVWVLMAFKTSRAESTGALLKVREGPKAILHRVCWRS